MMFDDVKTYISENIYHSAPFENLTEDKQRKAVNQAEKILYAAFKGYHPERKQLPVDAVSYQVLWLIAKDASIQKAELGLASQSIDGMSQSFIAMDRTIAPEVKRILSKRVGSYGLTVSQTRRGVYID